MADRPGVLAASPRALAEHYDVALLDLDGVVYRGEHPVEHAAEALEAARRSGIRWEFVTNNASRRAEEVVALLRSVGVPADVAQVVTSAQATATLLATRLAPGAAVLVVGTDALAYELSSVGLRPVREDGPEVEAVVQGYGRTVGWAQLAEACVAVRRGVPWIATNTDVTVPSPRGPLPGNGAMVAALAAATGVRPAEVVGKPHPGLHQESVRRSGAARPLVVGDRLDTDIEGAVTGGSDSLLVLTGVSGPDELLEAPAVRRPTYLSPDLRGLLVPHPAPAQDGAVTTCGDWEVRREAAVLVLAGAGDQVDALRALCAASWAGDRPASTAEAADGEAEAALRRWSLG